MYTKDELSLMSEAELASIAQKAGVEVNPEAMTSIEMADAIAQFQEEPVTPAITVRPKRAKSAKAKAADSPPTSERKQKKFRIIVHNQEGVESSPFVKVQPNGRMYAIPREKEVIVPEIVVRVLEDAIITRHIPAPDGKGMTTISQRRFPFTNLGPA